jgi:hypothetical protein
VSLVKPVEVELVESAAWFNKLLARYESGLEFKVASFWRESGEIRFCVLASIPDKELEERK